MRTKNSYKLKSKKIYLIRHGQTDFNLKSIVQGCGIDSSLNETGLSQARAFFETYKHIKFDKVYTSVLQRSIQSVQQFIDLGIPHERLEGLNEINWGTREGQVITPEEDEYYHQVIKAWQEGQVDLPIEGGESPIDVVAKQKPALDHILSNTDEETVLVCMHGRAMRALLCTVLKYPLSSMDYFEHENLCLYELNYTGSMFSVSKFNHTKHLNALK